VLKKMKLKHWERSLTIIVQYVIYKVLEKNQLYNWSVNIYSIWIVFAQDYRRDGTDLQLV
jgi:hypothetical protein